MYEFSQLMAFIRSNLACRLRAVMCARSLAGLLACICLVAFDAAAEITKKVRITTEPAGAEIFLVLGARRIPVGASPADAEIEFHSEQSVVRIFAQKLGYEPKTVELEARQPTLTIKLERRAATEKVAATEMGPKSDLRKRVASVVEENFPALLERHGRFGAQLGRPAKVTELDGRDYLVISVDLLRRGENQYGSASEVPLQDIWKQLASQLIIPLWGSLRAVPELAGIVLDVGYGELLSGFSVNARIEMETEMQCVPGTRQESRWNPCVRQRSETYTDSRGIRHTRYIGCEGANELATVFDPCARRVPVQRSKVVMDPKVNLDGGVARARFVTAASVLDEKQSGLPAFEHIEVSATDLQGVNILKRKAAAAAPANAAPTPQGEGALLPLTEN